MDEPNELKIIKKEKWIINSGIDLEKNWYYILLLLDFKFIFFIDLDIIINILKCVVIN